MLALWGGWQGLRVMVEKIESLSQGDLEERGHSQVSVFGVYTDERGDAARNTLSLLSDPHQSDICSQQMAEQ